MPVASRDPCHGGATRLVLRVVLQEACTTPTAPLERELVVVAWARDDNNIHGIGSGACDVVVRRTGERGKSVPDLTSETWTQPSVTRARAADTRR